MVSIIIPTFNREATIERAIKSVLEQSYKDLELIVIDDGSTDQTGMIVEQIHDDRIKYHYQENTGACAARNTGVSVAKGDYIAFQDSDDSWLPDKLARQMSTIEKTDADILFGQIRRCNLGKGTSVIPELHESGFINYQDLMVGISTQTLFMKRKVADNIRFDENMPRFQDLEWLLRAAKNYSVYGMAEVLVDCYISPDSISGSNDKLLPGIGRIHEKYPELEKEAPEVHRVLREFIINEGVNLFHRKNLDYKDYLLLGFSMSDKLRDRLKYYSVKLGLYRACYSINRRIKNEMLKKEWAKLPGDRDEITKTDNK